VSVLAAEWTFGDFMLSVLWVFSFVILIWLLITVFSDLFRRHDVHGWVKVLWILFVIIMPFLGVFVYIITQGHGMAERNQKAMEQQKVALREFVATPADELERLSKLHDAGKLSDDEFAQLKAKVLQGT
jgi:Short C-terminal domain/Phospholipase_D-nuclease N-terminal